MIELGGDRAAAGKERAAAAFDNDAILQFLYVDADRAQPAAIVAMRSDSFTRSS